MDATPAPTDNPLPSDVPTLQAMVRQLQSQVEELTAKLDAAIKHRFGRRSERRSQPQSAELKPPRRRDEHGRSELPAHLERREVLHDLTEAEKLCPRCRQMREFIGEQTAEQRRLREEDRRAIRMRESAGVLADLQSWRESMAKEALPKSALGTAVGYLTNNWDSLVRYRDAGYLSIDNNLAERTLRAVAVGRNNWGVLGSEVGGETAAKLYSVVGSCKH